MAPELIIAGLILLALVVYSLTGGADFGGGLWDLLAMGPRARVQRDTISRALGPIWEANHVWLIVVLVLLWTCFPRVFAGVGTALHVPLTLTLFGIVLRGSAFVFRSYGPQDLRSQLSWSWVFSVASLITPITFGLCIGAISSGALPMDPETGRVQTDFVSSWAAAFPLATGVYTLVLFGWLAATYLTNIAEYAPVRTDFQRRALVAGLVSGVMAGVVLALMPQGAPPLWTLVSSSPLVWGFMGGVSVLALCSMASMWLSRFALARLFAAATVSAVVLGWGGAMFPVLLQPDLTVWNAAAPAEVLWTTLAVFGAGSLLLVPSFIWLYRVFRSV
ncbi:MAG: cytochrome d ubiquinol oxidase subunit II [Myxococcota bacterium]